MEKILTDAFVISLIYLIVTAVSFLSVYSIFKSIETADKLSIPLLTITKLAFVCSTAYLLPLMLFRFLNGAAFLFYLATIPLAIIAIQKIQKNPISLKSAMTLFFGIFVRLIAALIVLGGISKLIVRIFQGQ